MDVRTYMDNNDVLTVKVADGVKASATQVEKVLQSLEWCHKQFGITTAIIYADHVAFVDLLEAATNINSPGKGFWLDRFLDEEAAEARKKFARGKAK